jgi:uncharacterized repeat protein (TIGR03833 family)
MRHDFKVSTDCESQKSARSSVGLMCEATNGSSGSAAQRSTHIGPRPGWARPDIRNRRLLGANSQPHDIKKHPGFRPSGTFTETEYLVYCGRNTMDGQNRDSIHPGLEVLIVQKKDQGSGALTRGIVQAILTSSSNHPHGIKVRLESGEIGRVKEIIK